MTYRLLIDECLSPELVEVAIGAGKCHGESDACPWTPTVKSG